MNWQDFIEISKSESTPNFFVNICQTISDPQHRLWTSLGLSLIIAGLSMGLKSIEPIERVENLSINLLLQFQPSDDENLILLKSPLRVLGELNNPQILTAALKKINQDAKPQAFITDSNLKQYLPTTSPERQWKLNNRIFDRLKSMTTESVAELSSAQLKDIFNGKIIVIGERDTLINKPLTAVGVASVEENRTALNSSLNLLKIQSKSEEFIWIFVWCNLSVFAIWQMRARLFVTTIAVVGSQIILGGVLLIMGNSVPMVITSIAIISAGMIGFKVNSGLSLQHQKTFICVWKPFKEN